MLVSEVPVSGKMAPKLHSIKPPNLATAQSVELSTPVDCGGSWSGRTQGAEALHEVPFDSELGGLDLRCIMGLTGPRCPVGPIGRVGLWGSPVEGVALSQFLATSPAKRPRAIEVYAIESRCVWDALRRVSCEGVCCKS